MYQMPLSNEINIDNFAGGGGASCGIEQALRRPVSVAINHDPEAISMHAINHPQTIHLCEDVFKVKPREVAAGRKINVAWFSPDCKHHSKAKGGKPADRKIRGLAWVAVKYAALPKSMKPRIICLENVEEFVNWGPLLPNKKPDPARKGEYYKKFENALKRHGYTVERRELRACDYGAPTSRKRFFLIARSDGLPIVWPTPTHSKPGHGLKPYRTAGECIDWSLDCPSIFERKKALSKNTLRRIAKGFFRYVVDNPKPFIVPIGYGERKGQAARTHDIDQPMPTIVGSQKHALIMPFLTECANASGQRVFSADEPLRTQCAQVKGGHFALCAAFMVKMRGQNIGHGMDEPLHTITASGTHHAEVRAFLIKYYGVDQDPRLDEPLHTITTKDRFGLVTVHGDQYMVYDIGMRMLTPAELYKAQGFPDHYIYDRGMVDGEVKPLTKKAQVRMCGNSVCPPVAKAIVEANVFHSEIYEPERIAV